ncbi:hypothetical protein [Maricaulis sp.]|uniref:hypothetical protein n=1 Tax=Maricaulis sp. TaxID=1486257 RepID=UPI003A95DD92
MNIAKLLAASVLSAATVVAAASLASGAALAQQARIAGQGGYNEQFVGTRLSFSVDPSLSNFTLRVSGPNGYNGEVQSARVAPTFRLGDFGSVPDGLYTYEMTAATNERQVLATPPVAGANGRDGRQQVARIGTSMTGSFRVVNGQILQLDPAASER